MGDHSASTWRAWRCRNPTLPEHTNIDKKNLTAQRSVSIGTRLPGVVGMLLGIEALLLNVVASADCAVCKPNLHTKHSGSNAHGHIPDRKLRANKPDPFDGLAPAGINLARRTCLNTGKSSSMGLSSGTMIPWELPQQLEGSSGSVILEGRTHT
jgi:hypothetical protein